MGGAQTKQFGGFRVCNFKNNSLGCLLGLEEYFDYIVGIDGVPLTQVSDASHDFFIKKIKGIGRFRVELSIYNSLTTRVRKITLNPCKSIERKDKNIKAELIHDYNTASSNGMYSQNIDYESGINSAIYQFINFDERISGLGIAVHWEEIFSKGIKVVSVQPSSPAQSSGLVSNHDYIIGTHTLKRPFYSTDDFLSFIKSNDNKSILITIYNVETEILREISIIPDSKWGGKGFLGCDIAAGPLYDIPLREKEFHFKDDNNINYIEVISNDYEHDGDDLIEYRLRNFSSIETEDSYSKEHREIDNQNHVYVASNVENAILIKDNSFDSYGIKQNVIRDVLVNTQEYKNDEEISYKGSINESDQNDEMKTYFNKKYSDQSLVESEAYTSTMNAKDSMFETELELGSCDDLNGSSIINNDRYIDNDHNNNRDIDNTNSFTNKIDESDINNIENNKDNLILISSANNAINDHEDLNSNSFEITKGNIEENFYIERINTEDLITQKLGDQEFVKKEISKEFSLKEKNLSTFENSLKVEDKPVEILESYLESSDEVFVLNRNISATNQEKENDNSASEENLEIKIDDEQDEEYSNKTVLKHKEFISESNKVASPEHERALEIFKQFIEIKPKLNYNPPGNIEYTQE